MTQEAPFAGLKLEDISIDNEGRVVITNPQIAEQLKAVAPAVKALDTVINNGCNTVAGCGVPVVKK